MSTGTVKDTINGVLIQIHNPGSCPNTVTLCQATNHFGDCVFVGMQAEENRITSLGKSGFTNTAPQQFSIIGTVNFITYNVALSLFSEIVTCFIWAENVWQIYGILLINGCYSHRWSNTMETVLSQHKSTIKWGH